MKVLTKIKSATTEMLLSCFELRLWCQGYFRPVYITRQLPLSSPQSEAGRIKVIRNVRVQFHFYTAS